MVDNEVDYAPLGLRVNVRVSFHRTLPYAIDCKAFSLICIYRAESPCINSVGQRPAEQIVTERQALKGRNPVNEVNYAPLGLWVGMRVSFHRALPYAIDCKAFSLSPCRFGILAENNILANKKQRTPLRFFIFASICISEFTFIYSSIFCHKYRINL